MRSSWIIVTLTIACLAPAAMAGARDVASDISRYRGYEMSTGYHEQREALDRRERALIAQEPGWAGKRTLTLRKSISARSWAADAHAGLAGYARRPCASCHPDHARSNAHVMRNGLSCRQCHGAEPIAGVLHYDSPVNLVRRHAYVCAKCHEGAGLSFAAYRVHEPAPFGLATEQVFPALFWAFWIMMGIAAATFALFLPHTALWGLREAIEKANKDVQP